MGVVPFFFGFASAARLLRGSLLGRPGRACLRKLALQRAHLTAQFGHGAMQIVDFRPARNAVGIAELLDEALLAGPEIDAGAQQVALRGQEFIGTLGLQQLVIGDFQP